MEPLVWDKRNLGASKCLRCWGLLCVLRVDQRKHDFVIDNKECVRFPHLFRERRGAYLAFELEKGPWIGLAFGSETRMIWVKLDQTFAGQVALLDES